MERLEGDMAMRALIGILALLPLSSFAMVSEAFSKKNIPLVVEFGFDYLHPTFGTIDNVVIRNPQTSTEVAAVQGGVSQMYPDTFAQTMKLRIQLEEERNAVLSFQSFLPLNALTQMDTGNTYLPEFVLYRTENQRPRVSMMGEMNLSDSWRAGIGADLGFGVTSEATVFLQSGAGKYSSQRISATVKPRVIPLVVLEYDGYRFFVKGENKVGFTLNAAAGAAVFPPLNASFDISYSTSSALFFDPWTFDLSKRYDLGETWKLGLGVSYQLWTGYESRAAVINNISGTFSNGLAPSYQTRNLWVPRLALEKMFGNQRWELSYEFKDSIFKSTPSGNGNYLDPPRHSASLGTFFPVYRNWELGVAAQLTRLSPQSVVKSDATEIGAPGYQASGWLYGGKLTLTVPFEESQKQ